MTAHRVHTDMGLALAKPGIIGVDSSSVLLLRNRSGGTFKPTTTGPFTFPNVAAQQVGTIVQVVPTAAAVLKNAAGSTFATCISGQPMSVQAMTTSTWAPVAGGVTAAATSIADVGGYTTTTTVETALQELYSGQNLIEAPITTFVSSAGVPLTTFADNTSASAVGLTLLSSGPAAIRWNNNNNSTGIMTVVSLPPAAFSATQAMVLHVMASKTGATTADATTFGVSAIPVGTGQAYDAISSIGGTTTAMTGNATAKTVQHVTLTFTGNLGDNGVSGQPAALSLVITPTQSLLNTDDLVMHRVWVSYLG